MAVNQRLEFAKRRARIAEYALAHPQTGLKEIALAHKVAITTVHNALIEHKIVSVWAKQT